MSDPAFGAGNAMNIATISAGFEKGDFLVREEQGNRVYFDFFEEVSRRSDFFVYSRRFLVSLAFFESPVVTTALSGIAQFNFVSLAARIL